MQNRRQILYTALAVAAGGIFLCWLFFFPESRKLVFSAIGTVAAPFVIGGALAFALNLLLRPLERLWTRLFEKKTQSPKALRRGVCLTLSVLLLLGLVAAVFLIVLPEVIQTVQTAISALQTSATSIERWWDALRERLAAYGIVLPALQTGLESLLPKIMDVLEEKGLLFVGETVKITTSAVKTVTNIFLGLVLSVYILAQKELLLRQSRKLLRALLPAPRYEKLTRLAQLVDRTFASFLSGQLIEAFIIGGLCCVGMLLFRFPYAGPVSVLVGFTALIPVFGAFIGTAVGAFLILLVSPIQAVWFVLFILVLQQLEGNLIYPRVVGKSVGLPPFWTLTAVTIGGSAFGVAGMLLGVPLMSVLYTLTRDWVNARLAQKGAEAACTDESTCS